MFTKKHIGFCFNPLIYSFAFLPFFPVEDLIFCYLMDDRQVYLSIDDPQDIRAPLGGSVTIPCRLSWNDAFGRVWRGPIPSIEVQWIIDGFGYQLDLLSESFEGRYQVTGEQENGESHENI